MCRWLAYAGPSIFLDTLITQPKNSLVSQSRAALESPSPTNGDGFGIGWYGAKPEPGLFRDILPAWNDSNLHAVSAQISSPLFFAHVRASTGTPTARTNCHPFAYGKRLFMHNGQIGEFERVRRALVLDIAPEYFCHLQGTTDSEIFFHLMLGEGLDKDPKAAFARGVTRVMRRMDEAGIEAPFKLTAAYADGQRIYAVRYASNDRAPTLYYRQGPDGSALILSEPLEPGESGWTAVPQAHFLTAFEGHVEVEPFAPA